jgi:hypothetical protein
VTSDAETEAQLGAVFDELVELIGEAKQAAWTAVSPDRWRVFDSLKMFLAEQAVLVDAELRLGTRAPWVTSPTAHRARNLAAEAAPTRDGSSSCSSSIFAPSSRTSAAAP